MDGRTALADVIARSKTRIDGRPPVVVFDLDGTLFDNGPRTWQILVELAESEGHSSLRKALDAMPRRDLPYLLKDTLRKAGLHDDGALLERAAAFWKARFFTDEYQRFDEPLSGALKYAGALYEAGATIAYLSGRDAPNMLVGCSAALRHHGFPVGLPRTAVVLKHRFEDLDLDFKREALGFIDDLGVVVGTFDNEPANCNLFAERWPKALHFFVETAHAPNPPPLHTLVGRVPDLVHT
jgi:hypothetical protein